MSLARKISKSIKPNLRVAKTQSQLSDPGFTYNQAGKTFNDAFAYGGIYGAQDILPLISQAKNKRPAISNITDAQDLVTRVIPRGMPHGPGYFLYITYPQAEALL